MQPNSWPRGGVAGVLHHFHGNLVAFEFGSKSQSRTDSLIFVGGLYDGLATVDYVADLVRALESTSWSVFQPVLSSSYKGWGTSNLDSDVNEIAQLVEYVKDIKGSQAGRVVLMGHSTGSQDMLNYVSQADGIRAAVDGIILQAPCSDREAIKLTIDTGSDSGSPDQLRSTYAQLEALARQAVKQGVDDETILPIPLMTQLGFGAKIAVTCSRFLSLASPDSPENPGEDDMFSSDLTESQLSKTFGVVERRGLLKQKLLVLISGADQYMPATINKQVLLSKWQRATSPGFWDQDNSGIIPNATHSLKGDNQSEPRADLIDRVAKFLLSLR